jgi:hypothetical protein
MVIICTVSIKDRDRNIVIFLVTQLAEFRKFPELSNKPKIKINILALILDKIYRNRILSNCPRLKRPASCEETIILK